MGFYAAMKLRLPVWSRLLNTNAAEHGPLLPILFHGVDEADRAPYPIPNGIVSPSRPSRERSGADIPPAAEAMRQFWLPMRFSRGA